MANIFGNSTGVKVSKIRKPVESEQSKYNYLEVNDKKTKNVHIKTIDEYITALKECQEDRICSFDFETTISKQADEYYKKLIQDKIIEITDLEKQMERDIQIFVTEQEQKKARNFYNKKILSVKKELDILNNQRLKAPLDPHMLEICTLSFTSKEGLAYVVFISHDTGNIDIPDCETHDQIRDIILKLFNDYILSNTNVLKTAYNLIFETSCLLKYGYYITSPVSDPMVMGIRVYQIIKPGYFIEPKRPNKGFSLKIMTKILLNHQMTNFNEVIKDVEFFSQVNPVDGLEYSGEDSDYNLRLHYYFKHLAQQITIENTDITIERPYKNLYDFLVNIDMPFTRVIGQMQFFGMHWNKEKAAELRINATEIHYNNKQKLKELIVNYIQTPHFKEYVEQTKSKEEIENIYNTYLNEDFEVGKNGKVNIVKKFLFDVLDAPVAVLTDTGQASTGQEGLLEIEYILKNNLKSSSNEIYNKNRETYIHPHKDILLKLLEVLNTLQKYNTLLSSHLEGREEFLHPFTQNIHAQFDMYADTGRLRSRKPNGQNIPRPDNDPLGIRNLYTPKPGKLYIMIDYDAFEMTIQSWYSKDQNMMNQINEGVDLHMLTAQASTGKDPKDITKVERTGAKITNFSQLYGGGATVIQRNLKKMYDIWLSIEECEKLAAAVKIAFPGINNYRDESILWARNHGYIQTIFGFRRLLPFIKSTNTFYRSSDERRAMNTPIQGSAADIMKKAQSKIYDMTAENIYPFNKERFAQVQQVHDEIVCEVDSDDLPYLTDVIDAIRKIMCEPPLPNFPVNISVGVSVAEYGWGNKIDIDKYITQKTKDVI